MTRTMKDSGIEWIGEIPENKNVLKNKYFIRFLKGKNPENLNIEKKGIPYIGASELDDVTGKAEYSNYTEQVDLPQCNKSNVLILWDGARASLVGRNHEGVISSTIVKLEPNPAIISENFLFYYLRGFDKFLSDRVNGTTIPHMNRDYIEELKFINFSIAEQNKIAEFLNEKCEVIDEIIKRTEQSIEEYKKLKQSVITEAVTKGIRANRPMQDSNIEWIGEIPEGWDIRKIKYIFDIKKDIAGKEGYTVLSITQTGIKPKNIASNEGQLASDYSKYQLVNKGDFAMNHMDLLTGWVDISKYNGVTSPDYRVFKLKRSNNCDKYFLYMMQLCYLNRIFYGLGQGVSGLGRWRLPAEMFLNFLIPIPPLDEQKEIADYLDEKCAEIDVLIEKKQQFLTEMANYKKSLIYEYVTGKKEVA